MMAYLQPYIGCVSLEFSCSPRECPGIEGGRGNGGKLRRMIEKRKRITDKRRTSNFFWSGLSFFLCKPKSSHPSPPFSLTQFEGECFWKNLEPGSASAGAVSQIPNRHSVKAVT